MERGRNQREAESGDLEVATDVGDDVLLLEAARTGHPGAWRVLVERHRPELVRRAARHRGPKWEEPEDRVQEGLARAWGRRGRLDPRKGSFAGWVARAGRRAGLDSARTAARREALLEALCPVFHPGLFLGTGPAESPADRVARRAARETVNRAVSGLTRLERAVVAHWAMGGSARDFRHPDGRDYAAGSYRETLFRARRKLASWGRAQAEGALAA